MEDELVLGAKSTIVIEQASFTPAGNISAYDEDGVHYHIHKRMADALNIKTDAELKFPMYAISIVKEIGTRDDDGNLTNVKVLRNTITKIYKDEEDYIQRSIGKHNAKMKIAQGIKALGTTAGLDENAINKLIGASI